MRMALMRCTQIGRTYSDIVVFDDVFEIRKSRWLKMQFMIYLIEGLLHQEGLGRRCWWGGEEKQSEDYQIFHKGGCNSCEHLSTNWQVKGEESQSAEVVNVEPWLAILLKLHCTLIHWTLPQTWSVIGLFWSESDPISHHFETPALLQHNCFSFGPCVPTQACRKFEICCNDLNCGAVCIVKQYWVNHDKHLAGAAFGMMLATLMWEVCTVWVIITLTPSPFIPSLPLAAAPACGNWRNHMMGTLPLCSFRSEILIVGITSNCPIYREAFFRSFNYIPVQDNWEPCPKLHL